MLHAYYSTPNTEFSEGLRCSVVQIRLTSTAALRELIHQRSRSNCDSVRATWRGKEENKTSPSVPIARGSSCLIDHASMTKRTKLNHTKSLTKSGTQETLSDSPEKCPKPQRVYFFLLPPRALRCCGKPDLRNIVSIVILCDLRVKVDTGG